MDNDNFERFPGCSNIHEGVPPLSRPSDLVSNLNDRSHERDSDIHKGSEALCELLEKSNKAAESAQKDSRRSALFAFCSLIAGIISAITGILQLLR